MKKTALIIFAIAILGLAGIYEKTQGGSPQLVSPAETSAATSMAASGSSGQTQSSVSYKDGTYTGDSEYTPYGSVQISVVISGGKITDVNFLQMPNDQRDSEQRTVYSEPLLKQTTLAKQSADIDFVTGATSTSEGYQQSLQSALDEATLS